MLSPLIGGWYYGGLLRGIAQRAAERGADTSTGIRQTVEHLIGHGHGTTFASRRGFSMASGDVTHRFVPSVTG